MNDKLPRKVQMAVNRLVSEEWFAGQMYALFANAIKQDERHLAAKAFVETAVDELNDHMKTLVEVAERNGYTTPSSYREFKKYANEHDVKAFETFKSGEDVKHYLEIAIESEVCAIASYQEVMSNADVQGSFELFNVIRSNYVDEVEHLQTFKFILSTLDAAESIG